MFEQIHAQDSMLVVELKPLEISNYRLKEYAVGSKSISYDSLTLSQFKNRNLADLLSAESSLFVKSYGLGSLATSSFRGGNASQTAVLWNGFSLNSSMNGVVDFSLIPSSFFNEITIQYGGESAQWGNGALGGSIHLNNKSEFGKGNTYSVGASLGSFGLNTQSLKTNISRDKLSFSLALFRSQAQNDFPYFKNYDGKDSLVLQKHANYLSFGLLSDLQYKLSNNKKIQFSVWQQNTERNIPAIIFQSESKAEQQDESTRLMLSYLWFKGANKIKIKTGYFKQIIAYQDSISSIFAKNSSNKLLSEISYDRSLSKQFQFSGGLLNNYAFANTTNYLRGVGENRSSIYSFIKYKTRKERWYAVFSARATAIGNDFLTPTFSFQNTLKLNAFFQFKSKISSVYRVPTLNDKYWSPGGNLNLLPENGFSEEVGVAFKIKDKGVIGFDSEVTLFNKNINNWIAWTPNGSVWSPENIKKVWSRGVESLSTIVFSKNDLKVSFTLMTNYVLSTNEKSLNESDNSLGKQLVYTPRYAGHAKLVLSKNQYAVSYRHNYTGYTFTTSDNSEYLTPFDIGAVHVSVKRKAGEYRCEGYLGIENIWGEEYVRIAYRPLPLINYSFGFNINLYKPNTNRNNKS
jgi:vitamin B12 transporter